MKLEYKMQLSIAVLATLTGLSFLGYSIWHYRHELKLHPKPKMTVQQGYALGEIVGRAWADSPSFNQNTEDGEFVRGFFAGMNSALSHIQFQTNSPHMVLELTNVLGDLDRIQKSNEVRNKATNNEQNTRHKRNP